MRLYHKIQDLKESLKELTRQQQLLPKIAFRRAIKSSKRFPWVDVVVGGIQKNLTQKKSQEFCVLR